MQVLDVRYYKDIPWEDYLALPGKSFSGIKNEGVDIGYSTGIKIGKLVHTYLLKPKEYNYEESDIVIPIARALVSVYNSIIKHAEVEIAATSKFVLEGLMMPHKGLADMAIRRHLVLDFKILAGDLKPYLERFKYPDQVRGYMLPFEAPLGLIVAFNKKTKQVQMEPVGQNITWWAHQIKKYGTPWERSQIA